MKIVAVTGYKNSGKTTLCKALIEALSSMGLKAGYIKRTQESVISPADTDSGSIRAGGYDTLLWGEDGFRYEAAETPEERDSHAAAARFFPDADIVILEGGKNLKLPKVWVAGRNEAIPDDAGIFAVYDRYGVGGAERVYGAGDIGRLAKNIFEQAENRNKASRVYIGDAELPMKEFVADFVSGGIRGMLAALKRAEESGGEEIRVFLRKR